MWQWIGGADDSIEISNHFETRFGEELESRRVHSIHMMVEPQRAPQVSAVGGGLDASHQTRQEEWGEPNPLAHARHSRKSEAS